MGKLLAFACSYTADSNNGGNNGAGISPLWLDVNSGHLTALDPVDGPSPSWMAISKNGDHAYVVNEVSDFGGKPEGGVTSFAIDRGSARLTKLNAVGSGGTIPAHCSIDGSGKYLLVANYGCGRLSVLPIHGDGSLGAATDIRSPAGTVGAATASFAPLGSFARSGHDASHAHMIDADSSGRYVLSNDLGFDQTNIWTLDREKGRLSPHSRSAIPSASEGAGPRHFAFHPNGKILFNLYEEASAIAVYSYEPEDASVKLLQQISTLPAGFTGSSFASAMAISLDGRFLYSGNRLHNSVAIFQIRNDGCLDHLDNEWTRGDYPNHVVLDPTGSFLFVCNRRSDQITSFRVNKSSGLLDFTGQYFPIGSPNMIAFADRKL